MKKTFLIICAFLSFNSGFAQISTNEKLSYHASYNIGAVSPRMGEIFMQTKTVKISKKNYLHLSFQVSTVSKWDSFFKIRDIYESYVDPVTLKPHIYKRNISEGGYTKTEKYIFKTNKTILSTSKKKNLPATQKTITVQNNTMDVVSMFYKVRRLKFQNFKIGQTKSMIIVFDEKEIPIYLKFLGKETIPSGNLGNKLCYKISITAKTKILKGKENNIIWLTADAKRIPSLIKFSVPIGTGQMTLATAY